jgi:hypothetical protein
MAKRLPLPTGVGLALLLALAPAVPALRAGDLPDCSGERVVPLDVDLALPTSDTPPSPPRPDRIRLFRIVPAFLSDPVGLDDDTPADPNGTPAQPDDGPSWLQVAIGNHNPFLDFRYAGDPGGVGYTRVDTRVQLLDLPSTGCTIGFQAVTPAGAQQGGIEDGPTVICPAFSLFHALDDGTAFQGFVSKNLHVASPANLTDSLARSNQLSRSVQYGMAVQRPLLPQLNNVYLFVEALGRYRYDLETSTGPAASLDMLPGMYLKLSESWWLSGGVILPVNHDRPRDARLWQVTCSFQF